MPKIIIDTDAQTVADVTADTPQVLEVENIKACIFPTVGGAPNDVDLVMTVSGVPDILVMLRPNTQGHYFYHVTSFAPRGGVQVNECSPATIRSYIPANIRQMLGLLGGR